MSEKLRQYLETLSKLNSATAHIEEQVGAIAQLADRLQDSQWRNAAYSLSTGGDGFPQLPATNRLRQDLMQWQNVYTQANDQYQSLPPEEKGLVKSPRADERQT